MSKAKGSFLVYHEWEDYFTTLSDQQLGALFRAVFAYERRGEPYSGQDPAVGMAMQFIRGSLDRNRSRYEERCQRNRRNVKKRWEKADTTDTTCTTGISGIPDDTKNTDNDHDNDHEHDNEHEHDHDNDPDAAAKAAAIIGAAAAESPEGEPDEETAVAYYLDRFSARISREAAELLPQYARRMGGPAVKAAIDEAINNGARSWSYVKAILMAWTKAGVHDLESLERYRAERRGGRHSGESGVEPAGSVRHHLPGETILE